MVKLRCLIWQTRAIELALETSLRNTMSHHPNYINADARLSIYSKVIGIQRSMSLGWIFRMEHLTEPAWWEGLSHDLRWSLPDDANGLVDALLRYIDEFSGILAVAFVQAPSSAIESSFRLFVRALQPSACKHGTAEFISIYSWLMPRLGLTKYLCLLHLLRLMRNTVHNNGVYYHSSNQRETVTYRNVIYEFDYGKVVKYKDAWKLMQFRMMPDVLSMIPDVVESNSIKTITTPITDPFV